jgi:hypothetical protein
VVGKFPINAFTKHLAEETVQTISARSVYARLTQVEKKRTVRCILVALGQASGAFQFEAEGHL